MNKNLFRAALVRSGITQNDIAKGLHKSVNTISKKVNRGSFTVDEAVTICDIAHITDDSEKCKIFLDTTSQ